MNNEKNQEIIEQILDRFHLNKLCIKCEGPLEKTNVSVCNMCDRVAALSTQIEIIETACMSIKYKSRLAKQRTAKRNTKSNDKPENK